MKVKGLLDRFEGDHGVILLGEKEDKVNWPRELLPSSLREGQFLSFHLTVDEEATKEREQEIDCLWKQIVKK